ncbi:type VII secretion system-associated protein [Amycolatopsis echigonensis]|uniref:Type III secretion system (T3SS) SseB-like protein n=2 Tax=Amycolatopsis echigonensis TaxID=2576905 RepID=A0A2N3WHH7_9PSEU|nr:type VII secretion system-associated protein [Amycolatopsis echigonensis]MBB2498992.1 type VII secretion system-associated protein [Amycolatopsis echigonensis]PKV93306.1 LOW QUALITY PROTEIN: type III secretion system (T3SS) SseB-like protein [Amycolatopsis niigatensis]
MAQRDEADRMVSRTPAGKRARRNAYPRRGPQGKPEITPEMRANARTNPNSWLYVIDEAFDARGPVPSWAVVGAYPVNGTGEVVEDFHPNDRYRPSPKALGFPEPRNELEQLLQMVRTEHRPPEDLPRVILDSTLLVYALSPVQRTVIGFHNTDGRVMVPAYTSKSLVPREWPHARAVLGRDIVGLLAGHPLAINPHDLITAVVPAEHLMKALAEERR